jgi:hypothetical protein
MELLYSITQLFGQSVEFFSHSFDAYFEFLDTSFVTLVESHILFRGLYSFLVFLNFLYHVLQIIL